MNAKDNPAGIGTYQPDWQKLMVLSIAAMVFGIVAYGRQLIYGEAVTGMRDLGTMQGVPWGLYIIFVVYFIGISFAGITVSALVRLLDLEELKPIRRMAELVTIISLIMGALCIIADVGQPLRAVINLLRYARPQSPFFGTFTLVISGYLFASLVYFYLGCRHDAALMAKKESKFKKVYRLLAAGYSGSENENNRHKKASFWLAIAILPLLVTAHSTLGFIFGLQVGRPGWHSAIQAPGFVILAGVSGLGLILVIAGIMRFYTSIGQQLSDKIFHRLSNFLFVFTIVYLYFMVVEALTSIYTGGPDETHVMSMLLFGKFAVIYWAAVLCLVIPASYLFYQWVTSRYSIRAMVVCGILVNIAAILKRYVVVIPSQIAGNLLPYETGFYYPNWVEFGVVVGILGFGLFLFMLFSRFFPLVELPKSEQLSTNPNNPITSVGQNPARKMWVWILILFGFVLQFVSYFFMAAPLGTPVNETFSNPRVPFAPTFFIVGVMAVFIAAIVYELLPDKK